MVALLKNGRINNRLLCEIATHPDFVNLLVDTEIYVNGVATMRLRDVNAVLEAIRLTVIRNYQPEKRMCSWKPCRLPRLMKMIISVMSHIKLGTLSSMTSALLMQTIQRVRRTVIMLPV